MDFRPLLKRVFIYSSRPTVRRHECVLLRFIISEQLSSIPEHGLHNRVTQVEHNCCLSFPPVLDPHNRVDQVLIRLEARLLHRVRIHVHQVRLKTVEQLNLVIEVVRTVESVLLNQLVAVVNVSELTVGNAGDSCLVVEVQAHAIVSHEETDTVATRIVDPTLDKYVRFPAHGVLSLHDWAQVAD